MPERPASRDHQTNRSCQLSDACNEDRVVMIVSVALAVLTLPGCVYIDAARHARTYDVITTSATVSAKHSELRAFKSGKRAIPIPGGVTIKAPSETKRCYSWQEFTHCEHMTWLRVFATERFALRGGFNFIFDRYGDVGAGMFREGVMEFTSYDEAVAWLERFATMQPTYTNDGLVVAFHKADVCTPNAPDRFPWDSAECDPTDLSLRIEVYQILINGQKPTTLPGAEDELVQVTISDHFP